MTSKHRSSVKTQHSKMVGLMTFKGHKEFCTPSTTEALVHDDHEEHEQQKH